MNTLDRLTDPGVAANAYQQLSPDKAAALPNLAFAGSNFFQQNLANRITNLRYAGMAGASADGLGSLSCSGSSLSGMMLAYNSSNLAGLL